MSARVKLPTRTVYVPKANHYEIENGLLHLSAVNWGERLAVFQPPWEYVVIEPDRGPDGKFIKKG